ncbi:MAG: Spy/CpxP family protein refolding chaperone [Desulfofustis sp.]|nr:Spy/CpxP family protein refolding chaperone [Desulfofustis sp.]
MRILLLLVTVLLLPLSANAASHDSHRSEYAGEEHREIKSLSEADIDELRDGGGWGLALAAELNGVPGPVHLLEMKKEIRLSPEQIGQIEALFEQMRGQAIELGTTLIDLERELNSQFAEGTINEKLLRDLLEQIAQVHTQLRFVHLSTHLKTPDILTTEQIARYNELRGYSSDDPCTNIPAGHNPEMWKKHNNCP